jgi:hypothetical protein
MTASTISYSSCRSKFLSRAESAEARVVTYEHPLKERPGSMGGCCDVVTFGNLESKRAILLISGTHGVEGYAGSVIQSGLFDSAEMLARLRDFRVVLVHAINPWGFIHETRVNEENIDLNRNISKERLDHGAGADSLQLQQRLYQNSGNTLSEGELLARIAALQKTLGIKEFFRTLQAGQYSEKKGLFYGGEKLSWSAEVFIDVLETQLQGIEEIVALDLHTGLGEFGIGELIIVGDTLSVEGNSVSSLVSPPVHIHGSASSSSGAVSGPLVDLIPNVLHDARSLVAALEFGTLPIEPVGTALIMENWARNFRPNDQPLNQRWRAKVRSAFFPPDDEWVSKIQWRAESVIYELLPLFSSDRKPAAW